MPVASSTAVAVSSTTSIPSIVSGLPARPMRDDPPAARRRCSCGARPAPGRRRARRRSRARRRRARRARRGRRASCCRSRAGSGRGRRRRRPRARARGRSRRAGRRRLRHRGSPARGRAPAPPRARPSASSGPSTRPAWPRITRAPPNGTRHDLPRDPGAKNTFRRARREPHAPGGRAVEAQRAVDLEEVEVRGHADRDVAFVDDGQRVLVREPLDRRLGRARRRRPSRSGRAARAAGCRRRTAPRPRPGGPAPATPSATSPGPSSA